MRKLLRRLRFAVAKVNPMVQPMLMMAPMAGVGLDGPFVPVPYEGMDSLQIDQKNRSEFAKAEEQFQVALPSLLRQSEKLGWWVLYSAQGFVDESADERVLREKYGTQIGRSYFLARIVPDPPEAEVTPNWFISIDRDIE